ncbi:uncharacterized protein LOC126838880 isoform X2 [Adelges cooleyi]|uniref:uncharacterized protein LOC126838880 isoform X2 n=1 Tax=Adelges cooleyi TaxID=133065 RepID=UPI0021807BE4|nr:uncharacterized protein LOC126838880 isoform X2 [Adelges cooleyi]
MSSMQYNNIGEYKIRFKAVFPCEPTTHHKLQYNLYFSRKSISVLELKGNMTYLVPFDDTVKVKINMAARGSMGGWNENAHVFTTTDACGKMKFLMGNAWNVFVEELHFKSLDCPNVPGVYSTTGFSVDKLLETNFPKTFFYGEYKMLFNFTSKVNEHLGCVIFMVDILRPWESY